jgi:hypothetical protein
MSRVLQIPSWRVNESYYHTFDNAVNAVVDDMMTTIALNAYRRRYPHMYHDSYDYTAYRKRCIRRVKAVMLVRYNRKLV